MKTSPLTTTTHTLDTSRTPMKKNTTQYSMKNYKGPSSTTGMAVDVPSVMQEMSGVSARNAPKLEISTDTDLPNDEHHEHLHAPLE